MFSIVAVSAYYPEPNIVNYKINYFLGLKYRNDPRAIEYVRSSFTDDIRQRLNQSYLNGQYIEKEIEKYANIFDRRMKIYQEYDRFERELTRDFPDEIGTIQGFKENMQKSPIYGPENENCDFQRLQEITNQQIEYYRGVLNGKKFSPSTNDAQRITSSGQYRQQNQNYPQQYSTQTNYQPHPIPKGTTGDTMQIQINNNRLSNSEHSRTNDAPIQVTHFDPGTNQNQNQLQQYPSQTSYQLPRLSYAVLEGKLNQWYPELTSLNREIINFMAWRNVPLDETFSNMTFSKEDFLTYGATLLNYFSSSHRQKVTTEVGMKVREKLANMRKNNFYDVIMGAIQDDTNSLNVALVYSGDLLEKKIDTIIMQIRYDQEQRLAEEYDELLRTLNLWYPRQVTINEEFINFMKEKGVRLNKNRGIALAKSQFTQMAEPLFDEFTGKHRSEVSDEIERQMREILDANHSMLSEFHNQIIGNMRDIKNTFTVAFLYLDGMLVQKVNEKVNRFIIDAIDAEYRDLENYLNTWLPNSKQFTMEFITYVQNQRFTFLKLRQIPRQPDAFFTHQDFEEFAKDRKPLVYEKINAEVKKILQDIDPSKSSKRLKIFAKYGLEMKFKPFMMYDLSKLKELMESQLGEFENCKSIVRNHVVKVLQSEERNRTKLDIYKDEFDGNKCFTEEVCMSATSFDGPALTEALKPYIRDVKKMMSDDPYKDNQNIQDEMDNTVYPTIQNMLKKKYNTEVVKAKCFTNYLQRTGEVDRIYNAEFLFDEESLFKHIQKFIVAYENLYSETLRDHEQFRSANSHIITGRFNARS